MGSDTGSQVEPGVCDWCGWWNSLEQFCSERCRFEWLIWQVVLLRMLDDGSKLVVPSTR